MKENARLSKWLQRIGYVVFLFVVVEMLVLVQQNRDLKRQLNAIGTPKSIEFLKSGEQVGPITLESINGQEVNLSFNDLRKQILLFIFSTTCPHCQRNLSKWEDISQKLAQRSKEINVMGVSIDNLDKTKKYCLDNKLNYTTLIADTVFERLYKVHAVPQTLLIEGGGKVKNNWSGELTSKEVKELMSTIGLL
jgi:peroxiredoxin